MSSIRMFNGKSTKTLTGSETYVDSDIMSPKDVQNWQGLDAFVASITGSGTVTPTIYYFFGDGVFGPAHSLNSNASTVATTFTVTTAFECNVRTQSHFIACAGWKVRFSVASHAANDVLSANASVR